MFTRLYQQVSAYVSRRSNCRFVVGYSGGVDSAVLLHSLATQPIFAALNLHIHALHINHQLHPDSDAWQQVCQAQCATLGVPFTGVTITVEAGGNLEATARDARFSAFRDFLQDGDVLLLAHHANDQAETVLYRLFRGAGVKGLAGIRPVADINGMTVLRPLLNLPKEELQSYANEHEIAVIFDSSNNELRFDRNFLRHQVLPVIERRWPNVLRRCSQSAEHFSEANELLSDLAEMDLNGSIELGLEPFLRLSALANLTQARQKNALHYWFSLHQLRISEKALRTLMQELMSAAPDAHPELLIEGTILRRFNNCIYLSSKYGSIPSESIQWHTCEPIHLTHFGVLCLNNSVEHFDFDIRYRHGGERITLADKLQSTAVKKLLQTLKIEPWRRDWLPLIYHRGELIAVADQAISQKGRVLLAGASFSRIAIA